MRVIETEMLEAIKHGRSWKKDNTQVNIDAGYRTYFADVYLHDNHIAEVICRMGSDDRVKPNVETLRAYPTRTTMSRLRALGVDVCTRKGEVMLNGEAI
jgi:hypothetical protein